jgi:hypothetical protein
VQDEKQLATRPGSNTTLAWVDTETRHGDGEAGSPSLNTRRIVPGKTPETAENEEEELLGDKRRAGTTSGGGKDPNDPQNNPNSTGKDEDGKSNNTTTQGQQNNPPDDDSGIDQGQLEALIKQLRGRRPDAPLQPQGDDDAVDRSFDRRVRYQIKKGDTLKSIARIQLGNRKAAPLIYDINSRIIKLDADKKPILVVGSWITLPSRSETLRYLVRVELEQQVKLLFHADPAKQNSREYTCRLGDTLVSIAQKHHRLGDARLWPLLARVNELSERTDHSGKPTARLKRGQILVIPNDDQLRAFLQSIGEGLGPGQRVQAANAPVVVRVPQGTSIAPGSMVLPPIPQETEEETPPPDLDANTLIESPAERSVALSELEQRLINTNKLDDASQRQPDTQQSPPVDDTLVPPSGGTKGAPHRPAEVAPAGPHARMVQPQSQVYVLPPGERGNPAIGANPDPSCGSLVLTPIHETRVLTQANLGDRADNLEMVLQVNLNNEWCPIVQYTVHDGHSSIAIHTVSGRKRVVVIDLPSRAARELAENDLTAHSHAYYSLYLADRMPF